MNTEISDNVAKEVAGWAYFDAACGLCVGLRRRWGPVWERRGLVWLPLQTPGTAARLGITETQLKTEMWLQLADGRTFGGVNAWSVLMRRVWWLWAAGFALSLPGLNALGRRVYRLLADNRHCVGGACQIPKETRKPSARRPHRHGAFLELP